MPQSLQQAAQLQQQALLAHAEEDDAHADVSNAGHIGAGDDVDWWAVLRLRYGQLERKV